MMICRVFLIILDGAGVGELPDADKYGDGGSNTLAHIAEAVNGFNLPALSRLGLGNIISIVGVPESEKPMASYGRMREVSPGKDSISGHWEIAGLPLNKPFPIYESGFPEEIIVPFMEQANLSDILGNKPASGTEIIQGLGEEHLQTGKPIVYTSADSVFQIAAHVNAIPIKKLYELCRIARRLLVDKHEVGRVIARPFSGKPGHFYRTADRKDFSVKPFSPIVMEILQKHGIPTFAIGKIHDLFAGVGFDEKIGVTSNTDVMGKLFEITKTVECGFIGCTLVDFDMVWGHRNDAVGFAEGLKAFDAWLPRFLDQLDSSDALIITADHGCDPTTAGTDHTREYVPVLFYRNTYPGINLGIRKTFADVAATIADLFEIPWRGKGSSFMKNIIGSD
jgi:phosphopentomutase